MSSTDTLWALVRQAVEEHPDRVLLRDEHARSLTVRALHDAAETAAAGLGVRPGQVVSWQLPSTLEAFVLLLALARVGAVQNPVLPMLRENDVRHITSTVRTELLIVPESWRGFGHGDMARAIAADQGFDVVVLDLDNVPGEPLRLPAGDATGLSAPPEQADEPRWFYFTSGTSAAPKGVRHSDASVIASSFGMTDHLGIADGDVYPIGWPITHIGGITMLCAVLRAGGTLVLFEAFDPATTGERMAAFAPTILGTGVPFFRMYLDAQGRHGAEPLYPALRTFVAGGAPTPPEIVHELAAAFAGTPVVNSYGLTEFPIAASPEPTDPAAKQLTTVGRPSPGVEVRIVEGEIRLRGPQRFLGYADPSMDAGALDDEGWVRSGDLGHLDDDGYLVITGRAKDVIIRNGENISALEVEDVLLRHRDIIDVTVVGLPDPRTGELVCAVVVPAVGATVDLASIAAHCSAQGIARQKTPERVVLVDAIERNAMGKVAKTELRARLLES